MDNFSKRVSSVPRYVWWLSGVLIVYTLLGFLLLPWAVERQLKSVLDQRLALTAEIESVYFNPYTMVAEFQGLDVVDADGAPLLQLQQLRANFQPTRLVLLRLQFAEISAADLDLYYQRDADGMDTVTRLARDWAATAAPEEGEPETEPLDDETGGPVPLLVQQISLENLLFHLVDAVPPTPFETTVTLASASVTDLATLPERRGTSAFTLLLEDSAQLTGNGELGLNPPVFDGNLALQNFSLATVSRYLQDSLPFTVDQGRLAASLNYHVDLAGDSPDLALDDLQVTISALTASQNGAGEPFLTAQTLQAGNGSLTIPENSLALESVLLDRIELSVSREAGEATNLEQLLAAFPQDGTAGPDPAVPETVDAQSPWHVSLQQLAVDGNRIVFNDRQPELPATVGISVDIDMSDIDNQPESVFPLSAVVTMDSGGELQLQGELGVLPALTVSSNVSLDALDLTVLQPYVNEYAFLQLDSALLEFQSEMQVNRDEPFAYRGDLHLREVAVSDQSGEGNLVSLQALSVDAMNYSLAENTLDISEILFDSLFARFLINQDGSTNIGRSIRPAATGAVPAEATGDEPAGSTDLPFALTIGRIRVDAAASDFTDLNLPIPFSANIHELSGTLEGLSAPTTEPAEFVLEGQVDEFGLLQLDSLFNPFDILAGTRLDLRFSNLQMPPLTPYVIKFAGREIRDGTMDVELVYSIEDGQLSANNQVVLRDLQLGDRVEHPDAMDLPLDLAAALLKDGNGVIDLEVPVSGDVTDPEFDLGPAIRRAVRNILVSIVSAPFRFLGSLLGGEGADLDSIRFQPGRSDLAPPERQVLQQLHAALLQRPQLALEIPLLITEADRVALQTDLVAQRITARMDAAEDNSQGSLTQQRQAALESLYADAGLAPSLDELQAANTIETEITNPLTGEPLASEQLDVQAYNTDIRNRLIEVEPISEQQLLALAQARYANIRQYLLELEGELAPSRLATTDRQTAELDEDGWLVMEFGLGTSG